MTAPTSEEQYLLELINEARLDPLAAAERYIASYSPLDATQWNIGQALDYFGVTGSALMAAFNNLLPTGPLAWSSKLSSAAEGHSAAMIAADLQSHQLPGEPALGARAAAEGYAYSTLGENIYAYGQDVLYAQAAFMVDWGYDGADYSNGKLRTNFASLGDGMQDDAGHRANIMNPNFLDVGIDVTHQADAGKEVGPLVITQDFGSTGALSVTGVAYTDKDGDEFYSFGEGRGDLKVQVGSNSVTSFATGGYSVQALSGENTIVLTGGGLAGTVTVKAAIASQNLKLDVVDGNTLLTSGSILVTGSISEIRGLGATGLKIEADTGNQTIFGTIADDVLSGGSGNDILNGGLGNDRLVGGAGNDIAVFEGNHIVYTIGTDKNGVTFLSAPESGKDTAEGIELFRFANGDFTLQNGVLTPVGGSGGSTDGYNVIQGTSRAETLTGTEGADLFIGGLGNDKIFGGAGIDIASYSGRTFDYTVGSRDQVTVIIGPDSGSDTLESVEIFRFENGDFVLENGLLVAYKGDGNLNHAPVVAASQNLSTMEAVALTINVLATDPDGNPLTFSALQGQHGTVASKGGGAFVYTPHSGFAGTDSFKVTIKDGVGGISSQTVNIVVAASEAANEAPAVPSGKVSSTHQNTPVTITIDASDPDGDTLTYSAAGSDHGTVTGGNDGKFIYTPDAGFVGTDDFAVAVSDGKGGVSSLTVTVTVHEVDVDDRLDGALDMNVITSNGFAGIIGGNGTVFGTNGFQHIAVADQPDVLIFDPSYNRGGDVIEFPSAAAAYSIKIEGSSALIWNNESIYSIPVGGQGIVLEFADGPRTLRYDDATASVVLGNQAIGASAAIISATAGSWPVPNDTVGNAHASAVLGDGSLVTVGGDYSVFGTSGAQEINYLEGDVDLDTSFNRGGDTLHLPGPITAYSAYIVGSTLVLISDLGEISIPFGAKGMNLDFGGVERVLRLDLNDNAVMIGNEEITSFDQANPQQLGVGGGNGDNSLDTGEGNAPVTFALEDGTSYTLTENANVKSYVVLTGFDQDDMIFISGASPGSYNFGTAPNDPHDLKITFNNGTAVNEIVIQDVIPDNAGFVYDEASAEAALGWNFISFG